MPPVETIRRIAEVLNRDFITLKWLAGLATAEELQQQIDERDAREAARREQPADAPITAPVGA